MAMATAMGANASASAPLSVTARRLWNVAQVVGIGLTGALLVGLFVQPAEALNLLWNMVIPLLPAVFLINPSLWRNACPLGTLNAFTGNRVGTRKPPVQLLKTAWVGGIVLLALLVPARRFLFNVDGPALAVTIVAVAGLALLLGLIFKRRSGFCNALCPVLPVEKLYGQAPFFIVGNSRCVTCVGCTAAGCIDQAKGKAAAQTLGFSDRRGYWIFSVFGVFAAAFPGFIVGYFTAADTTWAEAGAVYAHVFAHAGISAAIAVTIVALGRIDATVGLPILGATAVGLYYWYASPTLAHAYGVGADAAVGFRVAAGLLVAGWLWQRLRQHRQPPPLAANETPSA